VSALAAYAFSPRGALRMWQRNATVGRKTILTTLGPRFVEAVGYLAVLGLGLVVYIKHLEGVSYLDFIAPGVAAATVMFGAVIETTYNSFVRIHIRRVFDAVITTPLSVADAAVGDEFWAATRAVVYGIAFLIVMACFGLVHSVWALATPPVFLLGALAFAALGMTYTSLVSSVEHFNIFFTGVITPMFLFGGVFFPFSRLPEWAQVVGWCLPLSHLAAATRDLVLGRPDLVTLGHVAVLAVMLALLFPLPLARLDRRLVR
jgi:lipooligosaccharide transport system permease protein